MSDNLSIWVQHFNERPLPIFRHTAYAVNRAAADDATSSRILSDTILQDPLLTSRLLKIASSVMFNRTSLPVTTISQAVRLLGFDRIRDISLSLALLDSLIQRNVHSHVLHLAGLSLHAAVQANTIYREWDKATCEGVFIAALLYRLGELAFWSVSGQAGDDILKGLGHVGQASTQDQERLLGVTFNALTLRLTQEWHLSRLLHRAILNPQSDDPQIQCIHHGHRIATALEQGDRDEVCRDVQQLAQWLHRKPAEIATLVEQNRHTANELATALGLHREDPQ